MESFLLHFHARELALFPSFSPTSFRSIVWAIDFLVLSSSPSFHKADQQTSLCNSELSIYSETSTSLFLSSLSLYVLSSTTSPFSRTNQSSKSYTSSSPPPPPPNIPWSSYYPASLYSYSSCTHFPTYLTTSSALLWYSLSHLNCNILISCLDCLTYYYYYGVRSWILFYLSIGSWRNYDGSWLQKLLLRLEGFLFLVYCGRVTSAIHYCSF